MRYTFRGTTCAGRGFPLIHVAALERSRVGLTEGELFNLRSPLLTLGLRELLLESILHLFEVGSCLRLIDLGLEREFINLCLLLGPLRVLEGLLHSAGHAGPRVALLCRSMDSLKPLLLLKCHLLAVDLD